MIAVRNCQERGRTDIGWLKSYHSFSFGHYYNPKCNSFRDLRVINEDYVEAGKGFGMHPHKNMEILTYVVDGSLRHEDSLGNISVLKPGDFQRMTAGKGIIHSEYNDSSQDPVHFLQIWIQPNQKDLDPSHEEKSFFPEKNKLTLVADPKGREQSLLIHQDAQVYLANMEANHTIDYSYSAQRHLWVQVIHGKIDIHGQVVQTGDGLAISGQKAVKISSLEESRFLVFDLC
jgi:redox-sensitive bicupin YhaK (pirin superfamily)